MVTARRSAETATNYEVASSNGGVALLEKPQTVAVPEQKENFSSDRERMQKNLDKLLNYDRYSAQQVEEPVVAETVATSALADEDIRPTSTTMQFGEDIDQIRKEMNQASVIEEETAYRLNGKGRLAVILYSLAVTIVLALIILNTGVLATLNTSATAKANELSAAMSRYEAIQAEIESISDSNYIIDVAENQYGMVRQ